jgi:hypothetical protein
MVSTQLSLFDAATVIQPTYKVGDRVKVKRKTAHAPLLKKGDIVRIEAIHPHNGSCKFWNEVTESWGYLYPEEFVVLPPADKDDSVSTGNAQIADTEYTAETADNDDSVSTGNAQIVDTEYTVPTPLSTMILYQKVMLRLLIQNTLSRPLEMMILYQEQFLPINLAARPAVVNILDSLIEMARGCATFIFGAATRIRRSRRQKCWKCDRSWRPEFPSLKLQPC